MTNSIREIPDSEAFLLIGTNTTENHPVIASMIKKEVIHNNKKLVVIDPREIEMSKFADVYLQIKPGTNIAILNALMHVMIKENLYDREYVEERCEGFDELSKTLEKYTPEYSAEICGLDDPQKIVEAARILAEAKPMALYYCMGITQFKSGVNGVKSCSNMQQILGNLGVAGGGVNPLRGQNNVQGACDMGALNAVYPAYQPVGNDENKEKFQKAWKTSLELSTTPGLTIVESLNAAIEGSVKALYIMGENPVVSDPNQHHVLEALEALDFLVVQDIVLTETAQYADVVLPGFSFLEKEGTVTNTERRIQLMNRVIDPVGNNREDWWIITELANRMGAQWKYDKAEDIFTELRTVTPSYGGVTYERLRNNELLQWPCPSEDHGGTQYLHKGKFARGKGVLTPIDYSAPAEEVDPEYPVILTTGRVLEHFHTGTMSRNSRVLDELVPEGFVEMNQNDANNHNLNNGETVAVSTRRGSIRLKVKITDRPKSNVVFIPFHFYEMCANKLTIDALDPGCKIPEYKVCACKIEKVGA
jgi:formate dehydrogenase alpha subunit